MRNGIRLQARHCVHGKSPDVFDRQGNAIINEETNADSGVHYSKRESNRQPGEDSKSEGALRDAEIEKIRQAGVDGVTDNERLSNKFGQSLFIVSTGKKIS